MTYFVNTLSSEFRDMARTASQTRDQIVAAADELFYGSSFRQVSVDQIAAKAGFTKKTLYYHFRSKDDLMAAYLEARDRPTLERYQTWAGVDGSMPERMTRMFRGLAKAAQSKNWRGCGYIRAAAELADLPGHPAMDAARAHKNRFEKWLREGLKQDRYKNAEDLAKSLLLVLDGAITRMLIHRDIGYVEAAIRTTKILLKR